MRSETTQAQKDKYWVIPLTGDPYSDPYRRQKVDGGRGMGS